MATITYADLVTPLDRDALVADALALLGAAGFPVTSFGAFDEPYATIQFEADGLADCSKLIVEIGKMGITMDAEGDALTLHAKDAFDVDRKLAIPTQGAVTFTDTSGSPQSFGAGDVLFSSKTNPDITYKNVAAISVSALGTSSPITLAADAPGAIANIQASDLQIVTPPPGITMTVAPGLAWITQSGEDEESDESLRTRCLTKWDTLSTTGSEAAYLFWALESSSEVNRARVQENPDAIDPDPMVTVWVAGPTGAATTSAVNAADANVQKHRPLGTRVSVSSATAFPVTIQGSYKVKAAYAAAAASYISGKLSDWFAGKSIVINGETVPGINIGDGVYIAQVYEILMSAPGMVSVSLVDSTTTLLPNATYPEFMDPGSPGADYVATLVTSPTLLVPNLV